jgi:uncharacterized protein YfcZ (UPF0381/DUF406 family)
MSKKYEEKQQSEMEEVVEEKKAMTKLERLFAGKEAIEREIQQEKEKARLAEKERIKHERLVKAELEARSFRKIRFDQINEQVSGLLNSIAEIDPKYLNDPQTPVYIMWCLIHAKDATGQHTTEIKAVIEYVTSYFKGRKDSEGG